MTNRLTNLGDQDVLARSGRPNPRHGHQAPLYADARHAFSIRQHNLTALDLIVPETSRELAMRTNDGRMTGAEQLRIISLLVGAAWRRSSFERTGELNEVRDEPAPRISYFVAISTIEPRKNHSLLIQIWRRLIVRGGAVPKLVIVGKRGWESEQTFRELDVAPDLKHHIIEVPSLPSAHLRNLIKNAYALLMPSCAEGYGLPIVEALSLGTPVVCSDIPVFREVSQKRALLMSPLDGAGWLKAIGSLMRTDSFFRAQLRAKTLEFKPPTWQAYFQNIEAFLCSL